MNFLILLFFGHAKYLIKHRSHLDMLPYLSKRHIMMVQRSRAMYESPFSSVVWSCSNTKCQSSRISLARTNVLSTAVRHRKEAGLDPLIYMRQFHFKIDVNCPLLGESRKGRRNAKLIHALLYLVGKSEFQLAIKVGQFPLCTCNMAQKMPGRLQMGICFYLKALKA